VPSRYYFNLTDGTDMIPDEDGVDLPDHRAALIRAFEAIEELRKEDTSTSSYLRGYWRGWRLDIVDRLGRLVQSLSLDLLREQSSRH
jgi:hypothetical protein